tara:strand:- start:42 stop:479 length:438 start_codon:yes stop_codon:yes gene_type:complete
MSECQNEYVDYLDEDTITVSGQKYALISVVSPNSMQKNDLCGLKIRGVFSNIEEAQTHAKRLQKVDQLCNIYVVEMYKWLPIPPDDENIDNHEFVESKLNSIVKGYKEQQFLAKQHFEERKNENLEDMFKQSNTKENIELPPLED